MADKIARAVIKQFGRLGPVDDFGQIGSDLTPPGVTTKDLTQIQALQAYDTGFSTLTESGAIPPALEDMNSLLFLVTSMVKHLFQEGVAEWDATEPYFIGGWIKRNGVFYVSQSGTDGAENINNDPATDGGSNWLSVLDVAQLRSGATTKTVADLQERITGGTDGNLVSRNANGLVQDAGISSNVTITTSNGLSGGGDLTQNRVISGDDASTSQKGVVQLNDTLTSTSTTEAATANAVNQLSVNIDQGVKTTDSPTFESVTVGSLNDREESSTTTGTVFNTYSPFVSNIGDSYIASGGIVIDTGGGTNNLYCVSGIKRTSSTSIFFSSVRISPTGTTPPGTGLTIFQSGTAVVAVADITVVKIPVDIANP
jgi:hypothetical protein